MNDYLCPVDKALSAIEKNARNAAEFYQGLKIIKQIVKNIIEHPTEIKFKRLNKSNTTLSQECFNLRGMPELFKVLGFEESNGVYTHQGGDEKIKFLEDALKVVVNYMNKKNGLSSHKSDQSSNKQPRQDPKDFNRSSSSGNPQKVQGDGPEKEVLYDPKQGYFHVKILPKDDKQKQKNVQDIFNNHDGKADKKGSTFFSMLKLG